MKNTKLFMVAAVIALLTVAGGSLYASPALFYSPQRTVTATEFWSDADMFLSPKSYANVEFERWFGAVSFQSDMFRTAQTNMMQLGFATRLSDLLYTALYFGGNTLNFAREQYREVDGKRYYTGEPSLNPPSGNFPHNEAAVLIGIADMGFRLSYVHEHRSIKLNDSSISLIDGDVLYKSYTNEKGSLNPEIAWGMAKPLFDAGIQPHVYVDLDFYRDYKKTEADIGGGTTMGEEIERSNNVFKVGVTAAMGGYTLYEEGGFSFGVDLWYIFGLSMYNNDYAYIGDDGKYKIGKGFKGTYDGDAFTELSASSHIVWPYLGAYWSGEKLSLSAELELGVGFGGDKSTSLMLKGDGTDALIKDGEDKNTSYLSFSPVFYLGLQWAIVPDRFYLNAGSNIKCFDLELKTTTIDEYENDVKVEGTDTAKAIENTFGAASTSLMLGFSFFPTANLGVQAMSGVETQNNYISVFGTTIGANTVGLGVFSKIMVTLKF